MYFRCHAYERTVISSFCLLPLYIRPAIRSKIILFDKVTDDGYTTSTILILRTV